MDDNFFKQLDAALTNVGADKYWERMIGGHTVWMASVPFKYQHHINEILTNQNLGTNIIGEVKRMTLAYSIVGFDGFDLRPYRNDAPSFPVQDRESKIVRVPLYKYLLHKMEEWGIEWVDSAFDVFADITETIKKENIKEIKFDNARDKREELAELEEKVRELRADLSMPPLVEMSDEAAEKPAAAASAQEDSAPFNPFQRMPDAQLAQPLPAQPIQQPLPAQKTFATDLLGQDSSSTPDKPFAARHDVDVLEERSVRPPEPPIVIDPAQSNRNPRFRPQSR
jgi:hypothetical protein